MRRITHHSRDQKGPGQIGLTQSNIQMTSSNQPKSKVVPLKDSNSPRPRRSVLNKSSTNVMDSLVARKTMSHLSRVQESSTKRRVIEQFSKNKQLRRKRHSLLPFSKVGLGGNQGQKCV